MTASCCPQCGRDGLWNGQSGVVSGDVQKIEDRYRDAQGHEWKVER
ncbi:hypothetical protein [Actinocorallia libanotica]|uniref:Uncharacterized protein n=1 Tax=Actinocorallia libanotica TaxID=46162 RepID=A0ABN1Q286_9ACTN